MEKLIKVIKVLINTLMTLILIIGILFIFLYLIGIVPYVVETGSMRPVIKPGSLCFVNKHVSYYDIKENDIIAYTASTGDKITHRAIKITEEGIETKGDANERSDGISTTRDNYIGKNIFSIPKLGYGVKLIQTTRGKIILITIIIVILVLGFFTEDDKKKKIKKQNEKKE